MQYRHDADAARVEWERGDEADDYELAEMMAEAKERDYLLDFITVFPHYRQFHPWLAQYIKESA